MTFGVNNMLLYLIPGITWWCLGYPNFIILGAILFWQDDIQRNGEGKVRRN